MTTTDEASFKMTRAEAEKYDFANCETRADRSGPYHRPDVEAAILRTGGIWNAMAILLGRSRMALRRHVLNNPDVKAFREDVREGMLDDLEGGIFTSALSGDQHDRRFLLSTIGKNRGYSTRFEASGPDGGPVPVQNIQVEFVSPDQINKDSETEKSDDND